VHIRRLPSRHGRTRSRGGAARSHRANGPSSTLPAAISMSRLGRYREHTGQSRPRRSVQPSRKKSPGPPRPARAVAMGRRGCRPVRPGRRASRGPPGRNVVRRRTGRRRPAASKPTSNRGFETASSVRLLTVSLPSWRGSPATCCTTGIGYAPAGVAHPDPRGQLTPHTASSPRRFHVVSDRAAGEVATQSALRNPPVAEQLGVEQHARGEQHAVPGS
jgi:hypothetical protein